MNYQARPYYCGPASLQNALALYGVDASQKKLAELAGTTSEAGTDEFGMMRAIDAMGFRHIEIRENKPQLALYAIDLRWPVILCIDSWTHWSLVIPGRGRYILVDPANVARSRAAKHSPAKVVTERMLLRRWAASISDLEPGYPRYYGIGLIR